MKTIPVYHVEYVLMLGDKWMPHVAVFRDHGEAKAAAAIREGDKNYTCVRVVGPFEHQVPA